MIQHIFGVALSNLAVALPIALVAWAVQRSGRRPFVAHALWVLVLVKLVTPPLITAPVIDTAWLTPPAAIADAAPAAATAVTALSTVVLPAIEVATPSLWLRIDGQSALMAVWLLGSALVAGWSLARVVRFDRLLRATSRPADPDVQRMAESIAQRLEFARSPAITTTSARISPMVWWTGGAVRVVIPAALLREMDATEVRCILSHELAHVRRRDHLVRWLEWAACVALWWNPIAWCARYNLRINEEICCDAMVVASLQPNPRTYANSLLTAVEFLSTPVLRAPAMASAMTSGGSLERRLTMIISKKPLSPSPRWLRTGALALALVVLPFGVSQAEEKDVDWGAIKARVEQAVKNGDMTREQADAKYEAIKKRLAGEGERKRTANDWEHKSKRIEDAVANGELTREEADAKHAAIRKRMAAQRGGDKGSRGLVGHFKRLGIDADGVGRMKKRLAENGITQKQMEAALGSILRIAKSPNSDDGQLDPRLHKYLTEDAGLTQQQVDVVAGMARRVQAGAKRGGDHDHDRARSAPTREQMAEVKAKIWAAVKAGKVTEEQAEARWKGYLKHVKKRAAAKREGDDGEHRSDGPSREEAGVVQRKLDAAVAAGRISQEDADARWEKYLESFDK